MADDVQLTDLEVIQRYSLAVRGATAPRAELIASLQADLEWLRGGRRAPATAPVPAAPAKTAPTKAAPAKAAPAKAAAGRTTPARAAAGKAAPEQVTRAPADKAPAAPRRRTTA